MTIIQYPAIGVNFHCVVILRNKPFVLNRKFFLRYDCQELIKASVAAVKVCPSVLTEYEVVDFPQTDQFPTGCKLSGNPLQVTPGFFLGCHDVVRNMSGADFSADGLQACPLFHGCQKQRRPVVLKSFQRNLYKLFIII